MSNVIKKSNPSEKATEIKGLEVQFVSYVKKGANKKKFFIVKSKDKKDLPESNVIKQVEIIVAKNNSSDTEKSPHLIYGVVTEPDILDTDNQLMSADEIKKTAHGFLKNYRQIDGEHNKIPGAGELVESYVALADMEIESKLIQKGSWIIATEPDEETWNLIEKGEYTGYSLYGFAKEMIELDVELETEEKQTVWKSLKNLFGIKKDFNSELKNSDNNDFWHLFRVFENAIWTIDWEIEGKEYRDIIVEDLEQLTAKVKKMSFKKIEKSEKNTDNGDVIMNEELKKEIIEIIKDANDNNDTAKNIAKQIEELTAKVDGIIAKNDDSDTKKKEVEKTQLSVDERLNEIENALLDNPPHPVEKNEETTVKESAENFEGFSNNLMI